MCGIAGVIGTRTKTLVETLTAALDHRGPDGRGYRRGGHAQIGATRLSIIDPASGTDLITNERGTVCVAFNGEIYNHSALRASLEAKGHRFATRTDTEVIVHLYEEVGEECVKSLRGMFAFAILDGEEIFLARDRMGIKPLFYTTISESGVFIFASEVKAILQCPEYTPRIDPQAFADFVVMSHPVGTATFFQDVKSLAPGYTMRASYREGRLTLSLPKPYHSQRDTHDEAIGIDEALTSLESCLRGAVRSHLAADVPVALTLSGGLDSTVLALFARELQDVSLRTFTVADHEWHPDSQQAAAVAELIGSEHHPIRMNFREYIEAVPDFVAAEERPSSLYGLPFFLLCREVRRHARVIVHGEGADEIFGGYYEYLAPGHRARYVAQRLPLLKLLGVAPSERLSEILEGLFTVGGEQESLGAVFRTNLADPLQRHHLDPVDRASMAFGLETRVPYLDDDLVDLVGRFPLRHLVRRDLGIRKYLLRRLCLERFGSRLIDVALRGKLGVPSAADRFLKRLDKLLDRVLPESYLSKHPLGYCFEGKRQLVAYELFEEIFLKQRGRTEALPGLLGFLRARSGASSRRFSRLAGPDA